MSIPPSDSTTDEPDALSPRKSTKSIASVFAVFAWLLPIVDFISSPLKFLYKLRHHFTDAAISLASRLIFVGTFGEHHQTKFTFTQINEQYKESIKTLDSAIWWGFGVIVFCWYVFILLPDTGNITVFGLPLSKVAWLNISPAIILAMQLFFLVALIRVMILRLGIGIVLQKIDQEELRKGEVGDTSNVNLAGFLGMLIMLLRLTFISREMNLRLFSWTSLMLIALVALVLLAPQLTLCLVITWLLRSGYYFSTFAYLILTAIISITSLFLVGVTIWLYSAAGFLTASGWRPAAAGEGRKSEVKR